MQDIEAEGVLDVLQRKTGDEFERLERRKRPFLEVFGDSGDLSVESIEHFGHRRRLGPIGRGGPRFEPGLPGIGLGEGRAAGPVEEAVVGQDDVAHVPEDVVGGAVGHVEELVFGEIVDFLLHVGAGGLGASHQALD